MFCYNCGTKLPDEALFCANCGTRLKPENRTAGNTEKTSLPAPQTPPSESATVILPKPAPQITPSESAATLPENSNVSGNDHKITKRAKKDKTTTVQSSEITRRQEEKASPAAPDLGNANVGRVTHRRRTVKPWKIIVISLICLLIAGAAVYGLHYFQKDGQYYSMAQEYYANEEYDKALEYYDMLLASDNTNEEAYIGMADVYIAQERQDDAAEILLTGYRKTLSRKIWDKLSELF